MVILLKYFTIAWQIGENKLWNLKFNFSHKYVFTTISRSEKSIDSYTQLVATGKNNT